MTDKTDKTDKSDASEKQTINVHVDPDLDYVYRDIANVFVGTGDVVLEFGNFHRSIPGNASISNRIVLSIPSAYDLHESLGKALAAAQQKLQQSLNK
jgi:hypothetical protein